MNRLPILSAIEVVKTLQKAGFRILRQKGSHIFLRHNDGRATVVPVHKGETIDRGLLKKILRDANISTEEFLELLKK